MDAGLMVPDYRVIANRLQYWDKANGYVVYYPNIITSDGPMSESDVKAVEILDNPQKKQLKELIQIETIFPKNSLSSDSVIEEESFKTGESADILSVVRKSTYILKYEYVTYLSPWIVYVQNPQNKKIYKFVFGNKIVQRDLVMSIISSIEFVKDQFIHVTDKELKLTNALRGETKSYVKAGQTMGDFGPAGADNGISTLVGKWNAKRSQYAYIDSFDGENQNIFIFDLTTTQIHQVTYQKRLITDFAWSNDGKKIAYSHAESLGSGAGFDSSLKILDTVTSSEIPFHVLNKNVGRLPDDGAIDDIKWIDNNRLSFRSWAMRSGNVTWNIETYE